MIGLGLAILVALAITAGPTIAIAADSPPAPSASVACQEVLWGEYAEQLRGIRNQLEVTVVRQMLRIRALEAELAAARKAVTPAPTVAPTPAQ